MSFEIDQGEFMRTVSQTLGETAFVFVEETEEAHLSWGADEILEARISFHGPSDGVLALAAGEKFATELAANLLGIDPDNAEAARGGRDAVGELANILLGVLLERWFPGDTTYGMDVPVVRSLGTGAYEKEAGGAKIRLALVTDEGQRIDAMVLARGASVPACSDD
ncbi:MAG: chemotaxis protein CheX [Deltaproteobacteria bacterium]|nr:chemotaxis protein CheX [Deltaproteobacteria bacterium]